MRNIKMYIITFIFFIMIVLAGFVYVNIVINRNIININPTKEAINSKIQCKDKSYIKIFYNKSPFQVRIYFGDYVAYFNGKMLMK